LLESWPRHQRVVAYSVELVRDVALGASAYGAGIFHLIDACVFQGVLFLAAGSVIIAMHHEQDMRKMGGLKNTCPSLLDLSGGSLA